MRYTRTAAVGMAVLLLLSGGIAFATVPVAASSHTSFESAKTVTDGTYTGESAPATEALYYEVTLNASEQVNFSTSGAGEDLEMTLYGPDQATKLRSQNERFEEDASLTYTANRDATFYLEVRTTSDASTSFSLSVSTPDLTDSLEPNDGFSEATSVPDSQYDALHVAGSELDYYAVSLNASEQVTFSTEGASQDLEMTLYAPDQVTELRSQNERFEKDVSLTYTANRDATFYVAVDSTNDRSTEYSLSVSTPDLTDSLEPNDGFGEATSVSDGQYDALHVAGTERDYYAVSLNASEQVTFSTEGASKDLEMTLYAPDQVTELRSQNERFEKDVSLTYTANRDATFYLEVNGTTGRSTEYSLSVSTPDLTDSLEPNDGFGEATSVPDGRYDQLYVAGTERDYYAVSLNASEQVTFSTEGASQDLEMTLYAPDRVTKLRSQNERFDPNAGLTYTANRDGTFYLEVNGTTGRSTEYLLSVSTPDLTDTFEPNGDVSSATVLGTGRYRDLQVAGAERDLFAVPLNDSEQLTFRTNGASQSLRATVYAPDGETELLTSAKRFGDNVEFTYTADRDAVHYVGLVSTNNRSTSYNLVVNSNQTITLPNVAPDAEAGDGATVDEEATVTLDASGSDDRNGDSLSYNWTQVGGPSVSLNGSGTATPEFTAPEVESETRLTFELEVSDGAETDTDTVAVTVQSTPDTHESGVSQRLFDAVAGSDGMLDRPDVIAAVRGYVSTKSVDGVPITRTDVLLLVQYYVVNA